MSYFEIVIFNLNVLKCSGENINKLQNSKTSAIFRKKQKKRHLFHFFFNALKAIQTYIVERLNTKPRNCPKQSKINKSLLFINHLDYLTLLWFFRTIFPLNKHNISTGGTI